MQGMGPALEVLLPVSVVGALRLCPRNTRVMSSHKMLGNAVWGILPLIGAYFGCKIANFLWPGVFLN